MKAFSKFMSLLLCLELVVGPLGHTLIRANVAEAQASTCSSGTTFNSATNRCEVNKSVVETSNAVDRCAAMTDQAAQTACYKQTAELQLQQGVKDGKAKANNTKLGEKSKLLSGAGAVGIAVPLFFLIKGMMKSKKTKKKCNPTSLMLMYGAGAVLAVGEVLTFFTHRKSLKDMKAKWSKVTAPEATTNKDRQKSNATEAQSQAFEMLAQNEDSVAKVAKTKKTYYGIATGLFAAGTAMAIVETFQLKKAQAELVSPTSDAATITNAKLKIDKITCSTGMSKENADAANRNFKAEKENEFIDACEASGGVPNPDGTCLKKSGFLYLREKKVLQQNLISSKNLYEAIQNLHAYDNIEFEPYTRITYAEESEFDQLKSVSVERSVLEILATNLLPIKAVNASECVDDSMCGYGNSCINYRCYSNDEAPVTGNENSNGTTTNGASTNNGATPSGNANGSPVDASTLVSAGATVGSAVLKGAGKSAVGAVGGDVGGSLNTIEVTRQNGVLIDSNEMKAIEDGQKNKFDKAIYSPKTRIAINGVLAVWLGVMTKKMSDQQKISKERADLLRKMREDFVTQSGLFVCKEQDRNNPGKPECYCYTPDNQQNPARNNSQICRNTWGGPYSGSGSGNYLAGLDKVCLTQNDVIDSKCSCKQNNTCTRIGTGITMSGFNPGTFRMLSGAMAPANDLLGGNTAAGNMNAEALASNAARIKKANDDAMAKDPALVKEIKKMEQGIEGMLTQGFQGMSMGGPGSNSSPLGGLTPQQAAAELEKEIKDADKAMNVTASGGGGTFSDSAAPAPEPEFGLTEDAAAIQETEIAEVMNQNLDYGGNDISTKGSNVNIFEVLSDRYKRSGMRRLFDETGTATQDAPEKEIRD